MVRQPRLVRGPGAPHSALGHAAVVEGGGPAAGRQERHHPLRSRPGRAARPGRRQEPPRHLPGRTAKADRRAPALVHARAGDQPLAHQRRGARPRGAVRAHPGQRRTGAGRVHRARGPAPAAPVHRQLRPAHLGEAFDRRRRQGRLEPAGGVAEHRPPHRAERRGRAGLGPARAAAALRRQPLVAVRVVAVVALRHHPCAGERQDAGLRLQRAAHLPPGRTGVPEGVRAPQGAGRAARSFRAEAVRDGGVRPRRPDLERAAHLHRPGRLSG